MEILTAKLSKAEELCNRLNEIKNSLRKLEDNEKLGLPKFKSRFDEKSLSIYLEELTRAIKNPIRFRRKMALSELGIAGIENVSDEVFDDDNIDETIQILKEIQSYSRLLKILSSEISSWIIQNSIISVNSQLQDIRDNLEKLKDIEEISSEDVKDYILRKYVNREFSLYQINEFKARILKIEKVLNLSIRESEISLIDSVYKLINEIEEFGGEFKDQYLSLNNAKHKLEELRKDLIQEYEKIISEINFWNKLCPEVYVSKSKDIKVLRRELQKLKSECRKYHSFKVLEQIYSQKMNNKIKDLRVFAYKLDKVFSYFPDIRVIKEEDIDTIEKLYDGISWLEKIEYPKITKLFKNLPFEKAKNFLHKFEEIKKEYEYLKKNLSIYQRILGIQEEEQIDKYPLLTQKIYEYRNELQNKIGERFESIIAFLREEKETLETDEETLRNFIKVIKPLLKEVLKI